jgi:uncharacterized lipoprotein YddW (UPF0748 family)
MMYKKLFIIVQLFFIVFVAAAQQSEGRVDNPQPPNVQREFRAAWIASVANINWPSKPGLSPADQQKEAIALLDLLNSLNFNAAILQIRPQADALYPSDIEPWSYFLTGTQGQAPNPYYDPLAFWIKEAHQRGIELHVWLNPYRAHHLSGKAISEQSIIKKNPASVVKLKDGQYWMDPSLKEVQDHSAAVVRDIVKRYDIDGVHFDDYFYPYESYNGGSDFPDSVSWNAYVNSGGQLNRGDWRRASVNQFIERIYKEIKAEKKYVKFGLSPFGIWRPGYPESIQGMDQYDKLYADAKLWLNKGWIDYFTPQLYWKINTYAQSFPVLLNWWKGENTEGRHLWPGMNVGLGGDDKNVDEIINQIMITRGMLNESVGAVHWSIAALVNHEKLRAGLVNGPYQNKALIPESPWLNKEKPSIPVVTVGGDNAFTMNWNHPKRETIFKWVVYTKYAGKWSYQILSGNISQLNLSVSKAKVTNPKEMDILEEFGLTAIDRYGNESDFQSYKINQRF